MFCMCVKYPSTSAGVLLMLRGRRSPHWTQVTSYPVHPCSSRADDLSILLSVRPQAAYPGVEQPPPHHPPYYHHSHPPPPPHQAYHHHHHHPPLPQHEAPPPRFRDKQRAPPQHRTFASSPVSGALKQSVFFEYTAK